MVKAYQAGSELLGLADALRNKHLIEARDRSDHEAMIEDLKSDKKAFIALEGYLQTQFPLLRT